MNKLCTVLLLALFCSCLAQNGLTGGPGENQPGNTSASSEHVMPCTDPVKCCPQEREQCWGDPDTGLTCNCPYLWVCDETKRKCQQRQPVPGAGSWTCTWSKELYRCSKPTSQGSAPQGGSGWSCQANAEKQTYECSKTPPNPINEASGVESWDCTVSKESKLVCEEEEQYRELGAPTLGTGTGTGTGTVTITVPGTGTDTGTGTGTETGTGTTLEPGCPKVPQDILVIDLRCGWWGDDGGALFTQSVLTSLQGPCLGTVKIEYHHFDVESVMMGYGLAVINAINWPQFEQIWLLSGSDYDVTDLTVGTIEIEEILRQIVQSSASLLLAGGDGFVSHAGAAASRLGIGPVFMAAGPPNFFVYQPGIQVLTELNMGVELKLHDLFAGGIQSIADGVALPPGAVFMPGMPGFGMSTYSMSDYLQPTPQINVIGNNAQGKPCIGVTTVNNRRVVLDAGIQRFYAIGGTAKVNKDTLLYLQNIAVYLAMK